MQLRPGSGQRHSNELYIPAVRADLAARYFNLAMESEKKKVDVLDQPDTATSTGVIEDIHSQADGGRDAWIILAGAFVLEAVIWGLPGSFGVFQEYYAGLEPFKSHSSGLPAISTTANGIMFVLPPKMNINHKLIFRSQVSCFSSYRPRLTALSTIRPLPRLTWLSNHERSAHSSIVQ